MECRRQSAFTLVELLAVVAVIAVLAAFLFPVFAQAREKARQAACLSNMKQIGTGLMMYVQDWDQTYPRIRFLDGDYVWRNAIQPYVKNLGVFACPSNPMAQRCPSDTQRKDNPGDVAAQPCAEGWLFEPTRSMPISYGMNSCATTWYPVNDPLGRPDKVTPLTQAAVPRPAQTLIIGENTWRTADIHMRWTWDICNGLFTHMRYPGPGGSANFIFFDGHARNMKWAQTVFPISENKWELSPNPDPNNRRIVGPPGCDFTVPDPWVCVNGSGYRTTSGDMTRPDQLQ